ncbi:hypothetical protein BU197_02255 [Streptomyces sp. CBMA291]|nr:hypothetical protein [Streptomyces sp. CBMA291]MBD0713763.1 hypothetical protein [Streptomyces sp. CBMA370]
MLCVALATVLSWSVPAWASDGDQPSVTTTSTRETGVGVFFTAGDRVHISSTPPITASAHGWWIDPDGGSAKAKVTVELQVEKSGGGWRTVATGSKTVKQGGGSSRRANARKTCVGGAQTKWRSRVDVDIIGEADTPEKLVTPTQVLACGAG